ncbi:MAG: efflux RND transporter periplasmic adaptor subunit [Rhodopirellula sp.]|nr:efflux RND transporter periplasmic adaptor subunit [Rhodopirellula sp.]
MTTWKKTILAIAVIAGSSAGVAGYTHLAGPESATPPPAATAARPGWQVDTIPVQVAAVGRRRMQSELEVIGTLIPFRFANIASEVDGVIATIPEFEKKVEYELNGQQYATAIDLDIGHHVKKGDVLVEIDPTDYQLALERAEAQRKLAESELAKLRSWKREEEVAQLRAALQEAQAVLDQATADLKRSEELLGKRVLSQSDYDRAQMTHRTADASKAKAEAALRLAEAGPTPEEIGVAEANVAMARTEVAQQSQRLTKCTIHSPYDAVVVDRYVGVGDRVSPAIPIMQIIDPSILFAEVGVPERYQGLIRQNDRAEIRARESSKRVPGVVALVNEKIDPETRTFRVRVATDNAAGVFKAGSFVTVALALDASADALVVPAGAVTFAEGCPSVFVYREGRVEKRAVKLGISNQSELEVLAGLSEGEEVVVTNTALLVDGAQVRRKSG